MGQFGVKSKKLWIYEDLGIDFYIKIHFLAYFTNLWFYLDYRWGFGKSQGALCKFQGTIEIILHCQWTTG